MSNLEFTEQVCRRNKGDTMKLIVCLDDRNGMLFAGRRQSSDRNLTERICTLVKESKIWVDSDSAPLFQCAENICVDKNFLQTAQAGEYCFVEKAVPANCVVNAEEIIVFRWNRHYPADTYFPTELLQLRKLTSRKDFPGFSHDMITMEVYR